jgi:CheY-like chemotaxis protein
MTKPHVGLIAVRDRDCRSNITKSLRRLGWTVVEHASGLHVVQALSDVIIGDAIGPRPDLIVVDAISPGCSGVTIAAGFRDLGLAIPIILIAPAEASDVAADAYARSLILVDPARASVALIAIAKLMGTHHGAILDAASTEEPKRHVQ